MIENKINDQFKDYKKWFQALLMKEFLNLPFEKQKEFLTLSEKFVQNCKVVHEEAKNIKEKAFNFRIEDILPSDTGTYTVIGIIENNKINIEFPLSQPKPTIGHSMRCILYTIDEKIWYSSKTKLIEETNNA